MPEQINKGESVFVENADIEGHTYYAYYQPLLNADGSVAGAIGVAKESEGVQGQSVQGADNEDHYYVCGSDGCCIDQLLCCLHPKWYQSWKRQESSSTRS